MNISSIVIQTKPQYIDEIVELCQEGDFCDYHFSDKEKGKIIVTIEGENVDEEIGKLKKIQALAHVISAEMMMAYSEDELESEREKLESANSVPEILNDDTIPLEKMVYRGDLKKKIH